MNWFNYYGIVIIVFLMLPNILFAIFDKEAYSERSCGKILVFAESIGRMGCLVFTVFNVPYTYKGIWLENGMTFYIICNIVLLLLYFLGWIVFWKKRNLARALTLSVIPSILFLADGVFLLSFPLISCAMIFAVGHISISYKNVR